MDAALARSEVVLAVIGPDRLTSSVDGVARLSNPNDYVRRELARDRLPGVVGRGRRIGQSCFENVGPERVDPGQSTEALVGFNTDAEPGVPLSLVIDQNGVHYRVALG